ncbi:hypothetical protein HZH68_005246 [Vespula germanica]|uniref:Uncharacterized protein n=1 Tax=Vespula germanica TaxID=30212 RepID=A0A834KFX2_VESGE|nr:hypothetical protein HZH68_005246 [Vespula germanica]
MPKRVRSMVLTTITTVPRVLRLPLRFALPPDKRPYSQNDREVNAERGENEKELVYAMFGDKEDEEEDEEQEDEDEDEDEGDEEEEEEEEAKKKKKQREAFILVRLERIGNERTPFVGRSTFRHHQCLSFSVTRGVSERVDKESLSKEENEATEWCRSMPRRETPGYPGLSFRENLTMNG